MTDIPIQISDVLRYISLGLIEKCDFSEEVKNFSRVCILLWSWDDFVALFINFSMDGFETVSRRFRCFEYQNRIFGVETFTN